jgi:hypothetical protein
VRLVLDPTRDLGIAIFLARKELVDLGLLPSLAAIFGLATSVVIITAVVFSSQIETSTADLADSVQEIANHRFAAKVDHERKALIDVPDEQPQRYPYGTVGYTAR